MHPILFNLMSARKNKHVSIPFGIAFGCELGKVWLPHYAGQFGITQKLFMGYALLAAGNTGPEAPCPHISVQSTSGTATTTIP